MQSDNYHRNMNHVVFDPWSTDIYCTEDWQGFIPVHVATQGQKGIVVEGRHLVLIFILDLVAVWEGFLEKIDNLTIFCEVVITTELLEGRTIEH